MNKNFHFKTLLCGLVSLFILILPDIANASRTDTPHPRVARLSYLEGTVSFLPAGEKTWVKAKINRPFIRGDRVWADKNARLELQLNNAVIRLDRMTSLKVLNLNNRISQFQLSKGTAVIRVWRLTPQHTYEISTPNLAFTFHQPGYYRIDVDAAGKASIISIREGRGIAYGEKNSYRIQAGFYCRFTGKDLQNRKCAKIGTQDSFDKWCMARDKQVKQSTAVKYVAPSVIGYAELEKHGQWKTNKTHGHVWIPGKIAKNWAPYREGQWVWLSGWGWTWVDEQPWGFAPFHYGRWAYLEERWAWVPGPVDVEPVYAPALVGFIGGTSFSLDVAARTAGIAWFPLAPGEVYIPPYQVSRDYFIQVNTSNTIINETYITNIYNNPQTVINYQNVTVQEAITAVPSSTFVQSEPVMNNLVQVSNEEIQDAPVTQVATVSPEPISVLGGTETTQIEPSPEVMTQATVVKSEPPPAPVAFNAEQKLLEKNPGVPLAPTEIEKLQADQTHESTLNVLQSTAEDVPSTTQSPAEELQPSTAPTPAEPAQPPAGEATPPVEPVQPPADETTPPAEPIQPPTQEATPPVEPVQPPAEEATPPAEPVQPPADEATPPAEPAQPAVENATPPPVENAVPPIEPAQPPVENAVPPMEPAQPPVENAVPPMEPAQPPVENAAPPMEPAQPPVENAAPPAEPTQLPASAPSVEPTLPPAEQASPPAQPLTENEEEKLSP